MKVIVQFLQNIALSLHHHIICIKLISIFITLFGVGNMNIISVLSIIVFSLTTNIFSQVQFASHRITTNAIFVSSVYAVDVDGDGDIDVLSASVGDNKIA